MVVVVSYYCLLLVYCISAVFLLNCVCPVTAEIHGGTILAMQGRNSVVMVADSRFSSQRTGGMMITSSERMIYSLGSQCILGCIGLDSDARDLVNAVRLKVSSHSDLELGPSSLARCVSNTLYEKGLYCSPTIVGLDTNSGAPYICSMDGLGSQTIPEGFAVSGTASNSLCAICESLYEADLDEEALMSLAKRCMALALQRDVLSGGACTLYLLTQDGVDKHTFDTDDAW